MAPGRFGYFAAIYVTNLMDRSALHLAAESGNTDICEMLLAKNAYVNR